MGDLWAFLSKLQGYGGWATTVVLLVALWRGIPAIQQQLTARRSLEQDGTFQMHDRLQLRISNLEEGARLARKACDDELAAMRGEMVAERHHFEKVIEQLRADYAGLQRQFIQAQQSAARALGHTPPDFDALIDKLGDKRGSGK